MVVVMAAVAFAVLSGFVGTTAARADTSSQPALAGLTTDGSIYIDLGDGYWHYVDAATFAADGYSANAITWYGQLPGTVGAPVTPAT